MSFGVTAGLWSFLGVLLLLAVYVVQRRREERKVSSLYLWRMAAKYLQRDAFAAKVKKAVLFALRIISAVLACLLIARPLLQMPGSGVWYVAVIDASASMRVCDDTGVSRFTAAFKAAEKDMAALPWGSKVSVILAGDEAELLADGVSPDSGLYDQLSALRCGWGSGDLDGAVKLCRQLSADGKASSVMLYTDQNMLTPDGVSVTDVRRDTDWNFTVRSMTAESSAAGTTLRAEVLCNGRDALVPLNVLINGEPMDRDRMAVTVNGVPQESFNVSCPAGVPVSVTVTVRQMYDYEEACLQMIAGDGLPQDDTFTACRTPEKTVRVSLAGKKNYFMQRALSVFPQVELQVADQPGAAEGFDLYIYEECLPEELPADGAVWLIDPPRMPFANVTMGDELMGSSLAPVKFFTDEQLAELTRGLVLDEAFVVRFREMTSAGDFQPVLLCGQLPALLAGHTEQGNAALIMTFGLQNSNLPLLSDYVTLVRNMLDHSVPSILEGQRVDCGARLALRTLPQCETVYIQKPDKSVEVLKDKPFALMTGEPGVYTLMQELSSGRSKSLSVFAHVPATERLNQEESIRLPEVMQEQTEMAGRGSDAVDLTYLLAILLLVCLITEWVVYHAEKY